MESKLKSWLRANKYSVPNNLFAYRIRLISYFVLNHNARAIILLYLVTHHSGIISFFSSRFLRNKYGIECSTRIIGHSLMLPHPRNIIIAAESIGNNVQINQNVTIGGNFKKTTTRANGDIQKLPRIANNVVVCPNAVVGGGCFINDNVIIGANCVCTHDVKSNTLIYSKCEISKKGIIVINGSYIIK